MSTEQTDGLEIDDPEDWGTRLTPELRIYLHDKHIGPAARPAKPVMPPMNEELVEILGRPNFTCIRIAQAMRMGGHEIPQKAEYEQAHVIHFLLGQYFLHGADWAKKSHEALQAMIAKGVQP